MCWTWVQSALPPLRQFSGSLRLVRSPKVKPLTHWIHARCCFEMPKSAKVLFQWIGLREHLQETIDFSMKYGVFRLKFSLNPIHWSCRFLVLFRSLCRCCHNWERTNCRWNSWQRPPHVGPTIQNGRKWGKHDDKLWDLWKKAHGMGENWINTYVISRKATTTCQRFW